MMIRIPVIASLLAAGLGACVFGGDDTVEEIDTVDQALSGDRFRTVATGYAHSCGLEPDGRVACWGRNNFGQLGDGSNKDRTSPVYVQGIRDAVAVTAGRYHSCAIRAAGGALCWGDGRYGQLGNGGTTGSTRPVAVANLSGAVDIAAGGFHTCAVAGSNRIAMCWGYNRFGNLGNSSNTQATTPQTVGAYIKWFRGEFFMPLLNVAEVETGLYSSCARLADGQVSCWGRNNVGQLGDGTTTSRNRPGYVSNLTGAVDIDLGDAHGCAATDSGDARCWGANYYGQLGDGSKNNRLLPVSMTRATAWRALPVSNATLVAAGANHSCAVLGGRVYCSGRNSSSQLGRDAGSQPDTTRLISTILEADEIDAGGWHNCTRNGRGSRVVCFGWNKYGQLGDGMLCPDNPELDLVAVDGPGTVISQGSGTGRVYYTDGSQIDVTVRRSECGSLSGVRFGGVDLGTAPDPDGGTRYYQVVGSTDNGDGTADTTVRIFFFNRGNGASFPIEITASRSGGGSSTVGFTLGLVYDVPVMGGLMTLSEDELFDDFLASMYADFGTFNYYDRESPQRDLKKLNYDDLMFEARADGFHFAFEAEAVVDNFCNAKLEADGHFRVVQNSAGDIVTEWIDGPNADLSFPLYCDVITLFIDEIVAWMQEDGAADDVRKQIEASIAEFNDDCGDDGCSGLSAIRHFDGGLELEVGRVVGTVQYKVPYDSGSLADPDGFGNPIARGLALPPGQTVSVTVGNVVDACVGTGSTSCDTYAIGGEGLFNWSGETLIPSPWPSCPDPVCPYYKGRHDAWKRARGLTRDPARLPKPTRKVGAALARVFRESSGADLGDPIKVVGNNICAITAGGGDRAALVVGRNDHRGTSLTPFGNEYGSGDSLVTVGFIPDGFGSALDACPE